MFDKIYLIDGERASAMDIIQKARGLDWDFSNKFMLITSEGAKILKKHGYKVENNKYYIGRNSTNDLKK